MKGQVISINAGFYDILSNKKEYRTRGSGNLRHSSQSPKVGDFVEFQEKGFLQKVYPRNNFLERPKVANIDQVLIVTSLVEPKYSSLLLNKFLAIVEFKKIHPVILFTKKDLTDKSFLSEYKNQGYEVYEISNKTKQGIYKLETIFNDKLSLFTGQTGAGKSSTINSLTDLGLTTQKISKALGRGKHTTRVTKIIEWHGGRLIDSPGFSSLDFTLTKQQLAKSYADFNKYSKKCKFRTCIHKTEKYCEVKNMLKKGRISNTRYLDYLTLLKEAKNA